MTKLISVGLGRARAIRRFGEDERGIAVTEYGLLMALVALLLIGVVSIFGTQISIWFAARTNSITTT